jgi:hypothetical protein
MYTPTKYIVTNFTGDNHTFGDLQSAFTYMNSVVFSVFETMIIEYDCTLSSSPDGSQVFINGRERDRFGIYDRNLFTISINPIFD